MNTKATDALVRFHLAVTAPRVRDERGDVPGWVMITVLTIGLAIVIFQFAEQPLKDLLTAAFGKASGAN